MDLHERINPAFGLDFDHLFFFGVGQKYWNSKVRYVRQEEIKDIPYDTFLPNSDVDLRNASKVPLHNLHLEVGEKLCYLFDYGDEWRFYMILKDKIEDEPSDREPEVVKEKGEKIENQYGPGLLFCPPTSLTPDRFIFDFLLPLIFSGESHRSEKTCGEQWDGEIIRIFILGRISEYFPLFFRFEDS